MNPETRKHVKPANLFCVPIWVIFWIRYLVVSLKIVWIVMISCKLHSHSNKSCTLADRWMWLVIIPLIIDETILGVKYSHSGCKICFPIYCMIWLWCYLTLTSSPEPWELVTMEQWCSGHTSGLSCQ